MSMALQIRVTALERLVREMALEIAALRGAVKDVETKRGPGRPRKSD